MSNKRTVLVTGTSSGLGRSIAGHLVDRGYEVIATVRRQEHADALRNWKAGLHVLLLDVTDQHTIDRLVPRVREIAGEDGLCGLVNNAGAAVIGPVEFVPIADWRTQFEVNVFGQIALTQAMLPLLRQHSERRGKFASRIIMMSSIAGRVGQPMLAPYTASKSALESISDALRIELAASCVDVCIIEPGAVQSEIWGKGQATAARIDSNDPARARYGREIDAVVRHAMHSAESAIPAIHVARAVERCLSARRPPTRTLVGTDAKIAALAKALLPDRWFDSLIRRLIGL